MSLITNFFPIEIPFETFKIRRIQFADGKLDQLRQNYNQTHSFFRRDDFIYISPMKGVSIDLGDIVELDVQSNIGVVSSLIKHIFFRTFREKFNDILPLSFYPFRFLSRKNEDDLLFDLLDESLQGLLSQKKLIEVQFRDIQIQNETKFGAVINIKYQWIFDRNCLELRKEGFDLEGYNVLISEPIPGLDGIVAPEETVIGSIISCDGDKARVNTNEGDVLFDLNLLYLQKALYQFQGGDKKLIKADKIQG